MSAARRALVALLIFFCALLPAQATERILQFVSDVEVQADGDLLVTETIRVQAERSAIRHGILRDFPTSYSRPDGTRVRVRFDVQSVTRDRAAESYVLEPLINGVRVRIGRADELLAVGPHEFVIRYRTTRQIGFFPNFDELYWNVTGNGWTFPIDSAEARITLPARVQWRQIAFYTGPQGARGSDAAIVSQEPGRIVFRTTRPLPVASGLTVAAAWPKGVVTEPGAEQQAAWWVSDNLGLVVAAAVLLLVLAYYAYAFLRVGRDPRRGTIVPLFGPPKDMSAAAVRYVRRMGFDNRAYTAAIVDLAVRGHLRLVDIGKETRIDHRDGGGVIPRAEAAMEAKLFPGVSRLFLTQANQKILGAAKMALDRGLADTYSGQQFQNNFVWSGAGFAGSLVGACIVLFVLYAAHPLGPKLSFAEIVAGGVAVLIIGLALSAFRWLKAHTVTGRTIVDQIEGFRLYLGVAEEARLEALNPPQKTPELFERFLPYAIALDVENSWGRRFAGVLAAAAAAQAASSWYSGSRDITNDPAGFAGHLGSHLAQTVAAASSPPGSSDGSGGGGSSGGGGGGGGGSGW